jgi:hypothetical protein
MKKYKDLTAQEKQTLSQRVQLYGGIALIFVICALFLRNYNVNLIQRDGIAPTPRRPVAALSVTYRAQDDPLWSGDPLGDTGYTMGQEGSLFACLSMVLETNGISVTPQQLNQKFMENDLYVDGRAADVTRLSLLYPDVKFSAPKDFDGGDITNVLKGGRACMVRVKAGDNVHWLCVVGADEDDFLVLDPRGGQEIKRLKDYGNVFALGIIK